MINVKQQCFVFPSFLRLFLLFFFSQKISFFFLFLFSFFFDTDNYWKERSKMEPQKRHLQTTLPFLHALMENIKDILNHLWYSIISLHQQQKSMLSMFIVILFCLWEFILVNVQVWRKEHVLMDKLISMYFSFFSSPFLLFLYFFISFLISFFHFSQKNS